MPTRPCLLAQNPSEPVAMLLFYFSFCPLCFPRSSLQLLRCMLHLLNMMPWLQQPDLRKPPESARNPIQPLTSPVSPRSSPTAYPIPNLPTSPLHFSPSIPLSILQLLSSTSSSSSSSSSSSTLTDLSSPNRRRRKKGKKKRIFIKHTILNNRHAGSLGCAPTPNQYFALVVSSRISLNGFVPSSPTGGERGDRVVGA